MAERADFDKLPHEVITEDMLNYDLSYKLIIIGDSGVGKSCLMLRATKNEFREDHDVTIGVEYGSFAVKIQDKTVKILIWDTAGQETFQSVAKVFYKGSNCIFLVYDITNERSFEKLQSWLKEIREAASASAILVLVGNMLDLEAGRVISKERALEFKTKENMEICVETSAKSGTNVQDLFVHIAKMLYVRDKDKNKSVPPPVDEPVPVKIERPLPSAEAKAKRGCSC